VILWNTKSRNFITKNGIPLSLIDFAPSREDEWEAVIDETDSQSHYNVIIGQALQQSMGMEIIFSS
jgi:hypothetical protein